MKYIERNDLLEITKEIEVHPYVPNNDDIDPDKKDTLGNRISRCVNTIARNITTEVLITTIMAYLREEGLPVYLAYRCSPVLDITYTRPLLITPLTNIKRDEKEDRSNCIDYNRTLPEIFFNVYDSFGGLPTVSIPVDVLLVIFKNEKDDDAATVAFLNYWMSEIIKSFGGIDVFNEAIVKDNFSRQPIEDLIVFCTGKFIDNEIPLNAYDSAELAIEHAIEDIEKLHNRFNNSKLERQREWKRQSDIAKEEDIIRSTEYMKRIRAL